MSVHDKRWPGLCTGCNREDVQVGSRLTHGLRVLCDQCAGRPYRMPNASALDVPHVSNAQEAVAATLGAVPAYPVDALPDVARSLVRHGAKQGLPSALLGGSVLAAMAAAIGGAARIEVTPTWHERALLWVANLAPRGAGKSPTQDLAFEPLRAHDARLADDAEDEAVLLDDMTLEALARELAGRDGSVALDLDELAVLLRGLGEYKRGGGGDRGRFLKLWTGAPWKYSRVAGGTQTNKLRLRIARPTVVICGGLQPALHELLGGEQDGMRPRWLPHLASMPQGSGSLAVQQPTTDWRELLDRLLGCRGQPRTRALTPPARDAFQRYRAGWKRAARGVEVESVEAALVKADIHLARVALVLAEAEDANCSSTIIGIDIIDRAAQIIDFTLDCWRALPEHGGMALTRRDEILDAGISRLIEWLERHGGKATRRELQKACVAGARTPSDLNELLKRYEAMFPGTVTEARPERGGLALVVVKAPPRSTSVRAVCTADTENGNGENPNEHGRSGDVGSADTASADTASAADNGQPATDGDAQLVNALRAATQAIRDRQQADGDDAEPDA